MSVDHGLDTEPAVPVGGRRRAAPHGELGVPQDVHRVTVQGIVVDRDDRQPLGNRGESAPGLGHPGPAPLLAARIRVRVQQVLVRAHDAGPLGVREPLRLGGTALRQEGVVVEQEERRDDGGAARPVPDGVGVLGGDDAQLPAQGDQMLVAGHSAELDRILGMGPQLMVARHPDDLAEAVGERPEGPPDVFDDLPDVTGHQEPVLVRLGTHVLDQGAVLGVADVQVADGQQVSGIAVCRPHATPP
nr:polyketide synthase SimX4 [uncultured bacterium]